MQTVCRSHVLLHNTYMFVILFICSTTNKSLEARVAVLPVALLQVAPPITTLPTPHNPCQTSLTSLSQLSNTRCLFIQLKIKVNLRVAKAELIPHTHMLTVNHSLTVESNRLLVAVAVKGHLNRYHRVTSLTTHTITLHTLTSLRVAQR